MTTKGEPMTAPAPSPAEAAIIDRFGIFDEERVVEEVARAIYGEAGCRVAWHRLIEEDRAFYRAAAVAAVAAYRATDGGAEEAVRRVEAVAAELEGHVQHAIAECDEWGGDELARWKGRLAAYATSLNLLRAALAPQAGDGAR